MENSQIEWTTHTFNPWWGCTKISPACENCYAANMAKRWGHQIWGHKARRRMLSDAAWRQPLRWNADAEAKRTRARVFCASMADVFEDHHAIVDSRFRLWDLIHKTPQLDWLLLTKRPENIAAMVPWKDDAWPANVWLGATVENQEYADKRLPHLLKHKAAVRFLSCEPMLGLIDLRPWFKRRGLQAISWVISGGESGPGCRPMHPEWPLQLLRQCQDAGVPYHFKQSGNFIPAELATPDMQPSKRIIEVGGGAAPAKMVRVKSKKFRLLDGRTWDEFPQTFNVFSHE